MNIKDRYYDVAGVAERWKRTYFRGDKWGGYHGDAEEVYRRLKALPPDATSADVAAAIGNDTWAGPGWCDECGDKAPAMTMQLGQEPDYESATACVCLPCLEKAVARMKAAIAHAPAVDG